MFDEVKTGFRVAKGGAQELYGTYADVTTYAKAMANGYAIAAFGGRSDVMDAVGNHEGGVVHGGTYTGNLVGAFALRAASACLGIIASTPALARVDATGTKCMEVLGKVFAKHGVPYVFAGPPAMFGVHLGSSVVKAYRERAVRAVGVEADTPRPDGRARQQGAVVSCARRTTRWTSSGWSACATLR